MANRAERRKAKRDQPRYKRGKTVEELNAQFARHGITVKDYNDAKEKAYQKGWEDCAKNYFSTAFDKLTLCCSLVLHDDFKFGAQRINKFLLGLIRLYVDTKKTIPELSSELTQKTGLQLDFAREKNEELQEAQAMADIEEIPEIPEINATNCITDWNDVICTDEEIKE